MPLILGFAVIIGGVLLLTSGITSASFADVLKGNARTIYDQNRGVGVASPTAPASNTTGAAAASTAGINTKGGYINPLQHVTNWERTDQGVDANMPVGAPIVAPGPVKILGVIQNWYNGQPFIYWQLLSGPDAGKVQYVAEQITDLASPGTIVRAGQPIARYAASGTGIEFGWATKAGQTLAAATTGYAEGEITAAGRSMRAWLNSLGAGAGPNS